MLMKDRPQPKDLEPNSLLGKLIEQSVERFQSTEIDQKHSEKFGYQYPYLLGEAIRDTLNIHLIACAKPPYIVAGLLSSDTSFTPRDILPSLDELEENWEELFLDIATGIVDEEIVARYPHLNEEDNRRVKAAGI